MSIFSRLFGKSNKKDTEATPEAGTKAAATNTQPNQDEAALTDQTTAPNAADSAPPNDDLSDERFAPPPEAEATTNNANGLPTIAEQTADETLPSIPEPLEDDAASAPTAPLPAGVTRPLPAEPVNLYQPQRGHLVFGQSSDQGMVRTNNQDSAISFFFTGVSVEKQPDFGLFVVADGMGGHHFGEKASALTARVVASRVLNNIYMPLLENRYENSADQPTISEALTDAVKSANRMVLTDVPDAGTTLTAIVVMGNVAHIAHVGDSRAYLITKDGNIEQITRDHSLVQRLIELNQITLEESLEHPQRNVLYRAIGQNTDLEVDTLTRRLPNASHVLICSDGLWSLIEEADILEILRDHADPQIACDKLVALANENGGHDNITAVLIKMPGN